MIKSSMVSLYLSSSLITFLNKWKVSNNYESKDLIKLYGKIRKRYGNRGEYKVYNKEGFGIIRLLTQKDIQEPQSLLISLLIV